MATVAALSLLSRSCRTAVVSRLLRGNVAGVGFPPAHQAHHQYQHLHRRQMSGCAVAACGTSDSDADSADSDRPPLSMLNHVVGPVMRGPSSSHTAAPFFIGSLVKALATSNGETIKSVHIQFDPSGSFGPCYDTQGTDKGFAAGFFGKVFADDDFTSALPALRDAHHPFRLGFTVAPLRRSDHPNRVELSVECRQADGTERLDRFEGVSVGGGMFHVDSINGVTVNMTGRADVVVVETQGPQAMAAVERFLKDGQHALPSEGSVQKNGNIYLCKLHARLTAEELANLYRVDGVSFVRQAPASQYAIKDAADLYSQGADAIAQEATDRQECLARLAERYEGTRLGQSASAVRELFCERADLMLHSVEKGLALAEENSMDRDRRLLHLNFSSIKLRASASKCSAVAGSPMHVASYAALAVMEAAGCWTGPICAAPTSGAAGIVPGVLYSLKEAGADRAALGEALSVMSLAGALIAQRATFAAEMAGCAAETGAGGAMAAAGITHLHGGTPQQCFEAASCVVMNTLGVICDPVGGQVEIPCHAKNLAGVGHAYVASMSVIGGFAAVLPLDETAEQMLKVGLKMHSDYRCTSQGGCAATKTGKKLAAMTGGIIPNDD